MSTSLTDVTVALKQPIVDQFIVFIQAAQEKRYQEVLRTLSAHVWSHFVKLSLVPLDKEADARELLEKAILGDASFFQAPLDKVKESIDAWFTSDAARPHIISDLANFLNQKKE